MSTTVSDSAAKSVSIASFSARRWFTLIGLIPLGIYVPTHLLTVASAFSGPAAFDAAIAAGKESWVGWLFTTLLLLFVAYHAVIGIKLMLKSSPVSPPPSTLLHWQYILQRVSAIGVLLFIPAHVIKARILPALGGHYETFAGMHHAFVIDGMRVLTVPVYLLGTLGVAFHLANGLWTACTSLGLAQGTLAQKRLRAFSIAFFVFLVLLAYGTIFALMRG